jgi:hypothetical protein
MSKDKVTYILGAGASIGTFPLVKGAGKWEKKGLADILQYNFIINYFSIKNVSK